MSIRPSSFKRGGGFLDGVDCVITDYRYSDEFNGEPYKAGKIKDRNGKLIDKPHSLNVLLSVRVDGADEDTTTTLKAAGDFDAWEVSEDGHDVTPVEPGTEFSAKAAFSKFLASLVKPIDGEDGFPEDRLPEDSFDCSPIIGTRIRTVQKVDVERTKEFGKKVDKKTGKEYERKDLVVEHVYSLPGEVASKTTKPATGKAAGKTAAPAKSKAAGKVETADISEKAGETLRAILSENKGSFKKTKLSMAVLKRLMKDEDREAVRTWLFNDDNLESVEGVAYDRETGELASA